MDRSTSAERQFIMTGIFGGFTTFSAFSLQTLTPLQDGERLNASANVALSLGPVPAQRLH